MECLILIFSSLHSFSFVFLRSSSIKLGEMKGYLHIHLNLSSTGCLALCVIYIIRPCLTSLLANEERAMVTLGAFVCLFLCYWKYKKYIVQLFHISPTEFRRPMCSSALEAVL